MTLLTWMVYAAIVAALLGMAAWTLERGLLAAGRPTRWLWILAMAAAVAIPLVALAGRGSTGSAPRAGVDLPASEGAELLPLLPSAAHSPGPVFQTLRKVSGALSEGIGRLATILPGGGLSHRTLGLSWIAGALLLILTLGGSTLRLGLRLRRWPVYRLPGTDGVRITPALGPAVVGVIRPSIVLPRWALELEERHLRLILLHEGEHLSARDTLTLAAGAVLVLACFWNPPLWWMLGRLRSAVEMDCDGRVLARGVPHREYGALLLEVGCRSTRLPLHMAALAEHPNLLERRLRQMRPKSPRHPILALAGASVLATVLILVACDTRVPAPTAATDEEVAALPAEEAAAELLAQGLEPTVMGDETPAGETVGETVRVRIRTDQTLRAGEEPARAPLFIVDGVIVTADAFEGLKIEASDIQSIEVVKGAAAAARYGSRAENGVILITTKNAPGGGGA
jgi:TonB-dependent SusC/RagA subfamily outer membrane receptor